MSEGAEFKEARYPVVCSWCGAVIRFSSVEGSHGMCRPCFGDVRGIFLNAAGQARIKATEANAAPGVPNESAHTFIRQCGRASRRSFTARFKPSRSGFKTKP